MTARPFLKWAGGKGRLLGQMEEYLPLALRRGEVCRYVEPFVGGGALFFYLRQRYDIQEFFLFDRSPELVLAYRVVQRDVGALIEALLELEKVYLALDAEGRKGAFYEMRARFNRERQTIDFEHYDERWMRRAAQFIFLNRTCYNGLFRVNAKGAFNVPFGRYEKPRICHSENLRATSVLLQGVHIAQGDFAACEPLIDEQTFVYFDPPYRPISRTAAFNSYAQAAFGDEEQLRLASFYRELDGKGARLMLSNSDPKNVDVEDDFFEAAYQGLRIERIAAGRAINSKGTRRGSVSELLIMNY